MKGFYLLPVKLRRILAAQVAKSGANEHLTDSLQAQVNKMIQIYFIKKFNDGRSAAPEAKHGCEATESVVHGCTPEFGRGLRPTGG
jgi:hypothetical protein